MLAIACAERHRIVGSSAAASSGVGASSRATAERELVGAMTVGEQAIVADAVEAVRQSVQQEAADELVGVERHDLGLPCGVVLPAEG